MPGVSQGSARGQGVSMKQVSAGQGASSGQLVGAGTGKGRGQQGLHVSNGRGEQGLMSAGAGVSQRRQHGSENNSHLPFENIPYLFICSINLTAEILTEATHSSLTSQAAPLYPKHVRAAD